MADNTGLRHVPAGAGLATRGGLAARGRRDAAQAASNPDYEQAVAHYRQGRLPEAAAAFTLAAGAGHAESQYLLSTMLDAGEGIPQDDVQAALWEQRAADQGHAYAQANLSFRCYTAGDFDGAFTWCQRAAYSQLPWAQFHVGLMMRKGEGVAQSDAEAARWYRLAADRGFAEAQVKLAEMYSFGQGVPLSHERAAAWYRRAADSGNAEAQFQLGHLYSIGQGVETNYVQSRHWIRTAALQGHIAAARELKRREYRDA